MSRSSEIGLVSDTLQMLSVCVFGIDCKGHGNIMLPIGELRVYSLTTTITAVTHLGMLSSAEGFL